MSVFGGILAGNCSFKFKAYASTIRISTSLSKTIMFRNSGQNLVNAQDESNNESSKLNWHLREDIGLSSGDHL
jgi:hypothetical protein